MSTTSCTSRTRPGPTITVTTSMTSRSTSFHTFYAKPNVETETPEHKTLNNALVTTNEVLNTTCKYSVNHTPSHLQRGEECKVSLNLFADPERILRRFYVFAEEPCKSTITTSEPCSPVFKEAQPRPSKHSKYNISLTDIWILYMHVFLLLVI